MVSDLPYWPEAHAMNFEVHSSDHPRATVNFHPDVQDMFEVSGGETRMSSRPRFAVLAETGEEYASGMSASGMTAEELDAMILSTDSAPRRQRRSQNHVSFRSLRIQRPVSQARLEF